VKRFESMLEMRAPAWAETPATGRALLHLDEAQLLAPNEDALFFPSARPTEGKSPGIPVRVAAAPPERWDSSTILVRFHVEAGAALTPGQTGSVKCRGRLRDGLVVPASSVLDSPDGPYVLVVSDDRRTLIKRHIEIGTVLYDYAAVVAGLRENEYVAGNAFFLDAERRLRGGAP
jgi:multidrug efflux pump subunit AcrA (membrane-fusion protein)